MTTDNPNPDLQTDDPNEEVIHETQASGDSFAMFLFFCVMGLMLLMLLASLFWPWTYRVINSIGAPEQREYLGTVRKITYVGGLGADTQIDTENRTLLLRGVVIIHQGVPLEQRVGLLDSDVCIVTTDQCWHLMGS